MKLHSGLRNELKQTGKYMMDKNLAWGNAGNISARTDSDSFLITASGTYMGELEDSDLVECALHTGQALDGERKPSKEVPMHRAVYETRPDIQAVLHASPFYSTLIACSDIDIPNSWFVETMYYLERIERVDYFHPGSAELGQAVREKSPAANILLLNHHGVLVYDMSVKEARTALHTLEMTCQMLIQAKSAGIPLRSLPPERVADFLHNSGYKPRRGWPE